MLSGFAKKGIVFCFSNRILACCDGEDQEFVGSELDEAFKAAVDHLKLKGVKGLRVALSGAFCAPFLFPPIFDALTRDEYNNLAITMVGRTSKIDSRNARILLPWLDSFWKRIFEDIYNSLGFEFKTKLPNGGVAHACEGYILDLVQSSEVCIFSVSPWWVGYLGSKDRSDLGGKIVCFVDSDAVTFLGFDASGHKLTFSSVFRNDSDSQVKSATIRRIAMGAGYMADQIFLISSGSGVDEHSFHEVRLEQL